MIVVRHHLTGEPNSNDSKAWMKCVALKGTPIKRTLETIPMMNMFVVNEVKEIETGIGKTDPTHDVTHTLGRDHVLVRRGENVRDGGQKIDAQFRDLRHLALNFRPKWFASTIECFVHYCAFLTSVYLIKNMTNNKIG